MKPCPRAELGRQTLDWKSSRITTRNTAYSNIHFWNPGIQILRQQLSQITLNLARNKLVTIFLQKQGTAPSLKKGLQKITTKNTVSKRKICLYYIQQKWLNHMTRKQETYFFYIKKFQIPSLPSQVNTLTTVTMKAYFAVEVVSWARNSTENTW